MQTFLLSLLVKAVENEKIRAFLLEFAERIGQYLLPKLASLFPTFAAATGTVMLSQLKQLLPDLSHLVTPELGPVANEIRDQINTALPDGIDIPLVSEAVKGLTGFDLSDWLTGRGQR
jgi:hypothetical protein